MTTSMLDAALSYMPRTLPLYPPDRFPPGDKRNGKAPTVRDWPNWDASEQAIRNQWERFPTTNVGIRTGRGLVVLDVDPRHGGADYLARMEREHGELPRTVECATGGGGRHLYFAGPADLPSLDTKQGIEIKSNGTQVVAPPSVHPGTGAIYQWEGDRAPMGQKLPRVPGWALDARQNGAEPSQNGSPAGMWAQLVRDGTAEGERAVAIMRYSGHLLASGLEPDEALALVLLVNEHRFRPPLDEPEARRIANSIGAREIRRRNGRRSS